MADDIVTRLQNDAERCFIPEVLLTYADAVDEIERLRTEREALLKQIRQLKADLSMWTRIGQMAFTHSEGCLEGCRRACMCTCGYEHYLGQLAIEAKRG